MSNKVIETMPKLLKSLLQTEFQILDNVSYWNCLYLFASLAICTIYACILLIIPQHDVIKEPKYWYELIFIYVSTIPIYCTLANLQDCHIAFGIESMLTFRTLRNLFIASAIGFVFPYCISYVLWTTLFCYNAPVPFVVLCGYPMVTLVCIVLWFEFPCVLRKNKIYRKRIQIYMLSFIWWFVVNLHYIGLSMLFTALPVKLHWILAIIMPTLRHFNLKVYRKLVNRYAGRANKMAMIRIEISVGIEYSLFVAIKLASASEITLFLILGAEFLLNVHKCYRILHLKRKIRVNFVEKWRLNDKIQDNIRDLIQSEIIEILVPLVYFSTFAIAYKGPNATILGGIQNDYWAYEKIHDLGSVMKAGMEMFLMDFSSLIICGGILYKFSKINIAQEFCKVVKQTWSMITLLLSGPLVSVSKKIKCF